MKNLLHFIETSIFKRKIDSLLTPDEYREFQEFLRYDPTFGDIISHTGGCRKIRWSQAGRGKSGGIRVIYYYLSRDGEIYLLLAYPKNERDNLTSDEKHQLKSIIEALEDPQ